MAIERQVIVMIAFFFLLFAFTSALNADVFDVTTYGARPNMDISQALSNAWRDACALPRPSIVLIPGSTYKLTKVSLQGPCKSQIRVELSGKLVATTDLSGFKEGDGWVTFGRVDRLTLTGGGIFDGQGQAVWGKSCDQSQYCNRLPINIRLDFVTNSIIWDIVSLNSKQFHINVLGGQNVTFSHVTVSAPGNSPNTDGIHIGRSVGIKIVDTIIQTGDDCISLGDGSRQINITKVTCGPGHGISVGSLGKYTNEEPVQGITVKGCTIKNTANGVRIKTWPSSHPGSASDIHFEGIIMENVANPIIIDQEYCPWNQCTAKEASSRIQIKDVTFRNITGTSATVHAEKLICSKDYKCQNIELSDIDLKYNGNDGSITSQCRNVKPTISGKQHPPPCVIS